MTNNEAESLVIEYFNEITDIRGKIVENPGFSTLITSEPLENNLIIEIDNITSINYLKILNIYIDSILRITQSPETTNISLDKINNLCIKWNKFFNTADRNEYGFCWCITCCHHETIEWEWR
jgi:hypothetical protein